MKGIGAYICPVKHVSYTARSTPFLPCDLFWSYSTGSRTLTLLTKSTTPSAKLLHPFNGPPLPPSKTHQVIPNIFMLKSPATILDSSLKRSQCHRSSLLVISFSILLKCRLPDPKNGCESHHSSFAAQTLGSIGYYWLHSHSASGFSFPSSCQPLPNPPPSLSLLWFLFSSESTSFSIFYYGSSLLPFSCSTPVTATSTILSDCCCDCGPTTSTSFLFFDQPFVLS